MAATLSRRAQARAASTTDTRVMADCEAKITRLRSARSASTPPHIENAITGSTRVSPTNPRASAERVSR